MQINFLALLPLYKIERFHKMLIIIPLIFLPMPISREGYIIYAFWIRPRRHNVSGINRQYKEPFLHIYRHQWSEITHESETGAPEKDYLNKCFNNQTTNKLISSFLSSRFWVKIFDYRKLFVYLLLLQLGIWK